MEEEPQGVLTQIYKDIDTDEIGNNYKLIN